jgi:hypothetical protein
MPLPGTRPQEVEKTLGQAEPYPPITAIDGNTLPGHASPAMAMGILRSTARVLLSAALRSSMTTQVAPGQQAALSQFDELGVRVVGPARCA